MNSKSNKSSIGQEIWQDFLHEFPEVETGLLSMEEINERMASYMHKRNSAPNPDFEGLSPSEMHHLIGDPFGPQSPLRWNVDQHQIDTAKTPLLFLADQLLDEIGQAGEIKLTAKGNLPVWLCSSLVEQDLIYDKYQIHRGQPTEDKVPYLWPLKDFLLAESLAKKRHNKLSLTRKGREFTALSTGERLRAFIRFFVHRYHWGNIYRLEDHGHFGQMGVGYSLWLLLKFGGERREASFYLEKWGKVFDETYGPLRRDPSAHHDPTLESQLRMTEYAYTIRFFDSFCRWFGFADVEEIVVPGEYRSVFTVKKTNLLEKVFC